MTRHAAIAGEYDDSNVRLQNSQSRHQPGIVSIALAVKKYSIQRGLGCYLNRSGVVSNCQNPIPVVTWHLNSVSQAGGEVIQTQNSGHTHLPKLFTRTWNQGVRHVPVLLISIKSSRDSRLLHPSASG